MLKAILVLTIVAFGMFLSGAAATEKLSGASFADYGVKPVLSGDTFMDSEAYLTPSQKAFLGSNEDSSGLKDSKPINQLGLTHMMNVSKDPAVLPSLADQVSQYIKDHPTR